MISKILVGYDGSQQSEKAFSFALDMAAKYSAQMIVLSVAQTPEAPVTVDAVEKDKVLASAKRYFQPRFNTLEEKAGRVGMKPKFEIYVGHPAELIVEAAKEEGVDAIVMGHLGGNILKRWLLGSVSKRVLAYAHCTVVIVR
jgi:nucleotide-binding universal stress UspA family protein